jgi:uroporphyrinogen decarboxylase
VHHEKVGRFFRRRWVGWSSTTKRWLKEGLPANWDQLNFFNRDKEATTGINLGWVDTPFDPPFEEKTLEEDNTTRLVQDASGGIRREVTTRRVQYSMPQWVRRPLERREDWKKIKRRLQPDSKRRLANLRLCVNFWASAGRQRDYPLHQHIIGAFMHMRNLFGVQKLSITMYKDPDLIHEIMQNWLDLNKHILGEVLDTIDLDTVAFGEDICYKHGCMISPKTYRRFLTPYYKELIDFAKSHRDVKIMYDTDGNLDQVIPLIMEWGCDALQPIEIAAGNDPIAIRKQYGNTLALFGGIDKRALAADFETIEKEVERTVPFFLEKGSYIPHIDHGVPHNLPLENYMHYLKMLRNYDLG